MSGRLALTISSMLHLIHYSTNQVSPFLSRMVASVVQDLPIERGVRNLRLMSSQDEDRLQEKAGDSSAERQKRWFGGISTTKTLTIPTSYSFVSTAIKSTVTRGVSGGLVCLPSGYAIC